MALVSMPLLLEQAIKGAYGVGYFEAWDTYSLEAVVEAAEAERSPVILGFGGMMLDGCWLDEGGVELLGAMGRLKAERCGIPVSLLFNEAQTYDQALRGMKAGFNAVMLDTADWEADRASEVVLRLTREAHARGISVEAELGRLPDAMAEGIDRTGASLTDPEEAARFVETTGIDCLAVSIGNVHLLTAHEATVDLERLAAIRARVPVPLVIHGGTSFPPSAVREAIQLGAVKFNVGTTLKRAFLSGVRQAMTGLQEPLDVHALLGSHKESDLLQAGVEATKARVRELMRLYGSSGRAPLAEGAAG